MMKDSFDALRFECSRPVEVKMRKGAVQHEVSRPTRPSQPLLRLRGSMSRIAHNVLVSGQDEAGVLEGSAVIGHMVCFISRHKLLTASYRTYSTRHEGALTA